MVSITIFIIKHYEDSEFIILWTSGVKKIRLVNLILFSLFCGLVGIFSFVHNLNSTSFKQIKKLAKSGSIKFFFTNY